MRYNPYNFNNVKLIGFAAVCGLSLVGLANTGTGVAVLKTVQRVPATLTSLLASPTAKGAIAVCAAEGNCTPQGELTAYADGHADPGNGRWNMGRFSYQHGAATPAEADRKQLARLRSQGKVILNEAKKEKVPLNEKEIVNAIDLANQAPLAALEPNGGFIDRLKQCRGQGKTGSDAVLCARSQSFRNPITGELEAPGLGNSLSRVERDQQRRMDAIRDALASAP
ncbi:hypothetical protein NIES2135_61500 (plasmid) [Leptolyngbya boryana NIES-2135]|jgi:hypothetical protein|uniref:DUF4124 domain-containing protein n=1 Tax=Leptolyngbya boryana NIES-2135 TaxID=1973484 RepID=A0A1Z4JRI5_LEPBY|nr:MULTISPECIES: hypothetical protein [Leptolyngbya]BAY59273.1 hypothetical protein NIES2135_61500 [Leptolyngbya boryana NIES-2135]MBD2372861.1 hypothetical protein [Leptolyngbya sp. FACHB-238]MBD2397386.1 hypothetical protein [Leptolyngbya sp. FACHB-239]MBD2403809.1 hypothetical protein [Leptolyngbya sp. FACHB-402]ULP33465.1 hypothetical protein MCP04_30515 [Leptolyngbya boryana IU 594]